MNLQDIREGNIVEPSKHVRGSFNFIKTTEELLLDLGFKDIVRYYVLGDIAICKHDLSAVKISGTREFFTLKYIHEIQNLYENVHGKKLIKKQ